MLIARPKNVLTAADRRGASHLHRLLTGKRSGLRRGGRGAAAAADRVKLGPAAGRWPVSRPKRRDWGTGAAGTILVHALAIGPMLVLATHPDILTAPPESGIEMVFLDPPSPAAAITLPEPQPPPEVRSAELAAVAEPRPPEPAKQPAEISLTEPQPPPAVQSAELVPPAQRPPPQPAKQQVSPPAPPPRQAAMAAPRSPAQSPAQAPPAASAPTPVAASSPALAELTVAWRRALAAWLLEHKTYPEAARRRGVEGTVAIRFSVDRSGHVTGVAVLRGSGSPILDAAAEALLRDADLPAPPAAEQAASISVQIHYTLTD